jgi:hypothetical protein
MFRAVEGKNVSYTSRELNPAFTVFKSVAYTDRADPAFISTTFVFNFNLYFNYNICLVITRKVKLSLCLTN